tara:strand:+ start:794 stop:2773 length:1980 start_codon:yes stop_codon:yes gene_type:complete
MGGGLLNLVSEGNKNIFLNGNPQKSFFSTKYSKYTNFGMEKIRIDVNGYNKLNILTDSIFKFKIDNYGDLLMDTYFVVTLPNIWSSIVEFYPEPKNYIMINGEKIYSNIERNIWPYEFKWIDNLGSQMIKTVKYTIGGVVIQEFTGQYLYNMVQRDFSEEKKKLFNEMTGNTKDLNDPGNYGGRSNNYPNAIFNEEWLPNGPEPSIREKKIYVPLNIWSTLNNKLCLPILSFNKQKLNIEITCRPLMEICQVKYIPTSEILEKYNEIMIRINTDNFDINPNDPSWNEEIRSEYLNDIKLIGEYVKPVQTENKYLFYRFLNAPFSPGLDSDNNDLSNNRYYNGTVSGTSLDYEFYKIKSNIVNSDCHLICNYVFLSNNERNVFLNKKLTYLVKYVDEENYYGLKGKSKIKLLNQGLVTSWMLYFQRENVENSNDWSNYTNTSNNLDKLSLNRLFISLNNNNYIDVPKIIYKKSSINVLNKSGLYNLNYNVIKNFTLRYVENESSIKDLNNIFNNSSFIDTKNIQNICNNLSIILDGDIREDNLTYEYMNSSELYMRNNHGFGKNVLYYNFSLNSNNLINQPSGCIDLSKYNNVSIEVDLINPDKDKNASTKLLVNSDGEMVGINKVNWNIFQYNFNMHFMQERYILLYFENGNIELNNLI